jgi:hypothetical protein
MARVTYVKRAQQRYATVPVLDENGRPKTVAMKRKDGTPKVTKRGREVVMRLTVSDKTKPLPPERCGKCGTEITPGTPYKWIKPKSGPYGGRLMVRCGTCPVWQRWEYNHSLSAQLERIAWEAGESFDAGVDTQSEVEEILATAAEEIRSLAAEKEESAQSIEDGFGHPTTTSEELTEVAEQLNSWADDVEQADVPVEPDESEYTDHEFEADQDGKCEECGEYGHQNDETYDEALDAWRDEARDALSILDESPV